MPSSYKKRASLFLQQAGHRIPNVPKVRAFGNMVLWPIHKALRLPAGVTDVLGVAMKLDPSECVDRGLWFTPHLYDRDELRYAIGTLRNRSDAGGESVFIDAGANVGFWSLRVAKEVGTVRVIAVEANPLTARLLADNVALNDLANIEVVQKGLGGAAGKFQLFCGSHGNRGGDSFKFRHGAMGVTVDVVTLGMLCEERNINSIEFMKLDIEGMEAEVLEAFFTNAPLELYPRHMCVEHTHDQAIGALMERYGYDLVESCRENAIYSVRAR